MKRARGRASAVTWPGRAGPRRGRPGSGAGHWCRGRLATPSRRRRSPGLLSGLDEGSPGASEHCVVYLVSRSASDPDVVHVTEGWTSEEDHHRIFAGEAAQAIVARIGGLLAKEAEYTDYVPVRGRAAF
ncbi:putative quinol monooxygenase [Streptomyces sp. NPDC094038]|uniref:putative quinol monooxygenase n=1 Tax=Streptomyces sp. NPDC094038 TaxID=3366055 RepID=UPI00381BDC1A